MLERAKVVLAFTREHSPDFSCSVSETVASPAVRTPSLTVSPIHWVESTVSDRQGMPLFLFRFFLFTGPLYRQHNSMLPQESLAVRCAGRAFPGP